MTNSNDPERHEPSLADSILAESGLETPKPRRKRTGRKRSVFTKAPKPAWPVRGLWEAAPQELKQEAHATCMLILEYWLGKRDKSQVAKVLEVKPLRVWQLSQMALSGMMAALLPQPRTRVPQSVFEAREGESPAALKRRIVQLEKELARTEDLVRVLRTAPWASSVAESPVKEGRKRARKKKATGKRPARGATPARGVAAGGAANPGGAGGGGSGDREVPEDRP